MQAAGQILMVAPVAELELGNFGKAAAAPATTDQALVARASELHGKLDPVAQTRRTTAVLSAEDANGKTSILVGSSRPTLSPGQRAALQPGETGVAGQGHAEVTVVNAAISQGLKVKGVAASRPICPECQQVIKKAGGRPLIRRNLDA